jgi:hypothetical protein
MDDILTIAKMEITTTFRVLKRTRDGFDAVDFFDRI